jgi:hypothetical protein
MGTYIRCLFNDETVTNLHCYAQSLGFNNPPDFEYHATVIYSPVPLEVGYETYPVNFELKCTGTQYLGEGDWRALVVTVESEQLQTLYDYHVIRGYNPRFPTFLQHFSLGYKPHAVDLDSIKLPDFPLIVNRVQSSISLAN